MILKMISILRDDTSKDDICFLSSDVKVFLTSDRIFWTLDLKCTNSSTKFVSMFKLYNSTIKKTTTQYQIVIIENTINDNNGSTNKT
jgi:hypothetical protein